MPFKSKAQERWMWANKPAMAKRWEAEGGKKRELPERAKAKVKKKRVAKAR